MLCPSSLCWIIVVNNEFLLTNILSSNIWNLFHLKPSLKISLWNGDWLWNAGHKLLYHVVSNVGLFFQQFENYYHTLITSPSQPPISVLNMIIFILWRWKQKLPLILISGSIIILQILLSLTSAACAVLFMASVIQIIWAFWFSI